ncbi:MAG: hypothetical protein IPP49_16710 [Saprospiraceae bacterium]|nr:hypothetical protein [Saprospiraceae bacterium]
MPKIEWATSTCDQIFAQIVKALWGHAVYVKCYGGGGNFQFDRYFTNMSNAKSCGQSSITFNSLNVTGSFEVDFKLSANPEGNKYVTNGNVQNQGVVFGSGTMLEFYIMFGPNSNAPLVHFGITPSTDANFIKLIDPDCK